MTRHADIAVLGAGPAGMAAATLAANHGAATILLDENHAPGGQVYRSQAAGLPPTDTADRRQGNALRAALAASGAETLSGARVWAIGGGPLVLPGAAAEPFRLDALTPSGPETIIAEALILCPGTHERIIPFPGWTLPGVIGLAAATILLKAQGILPGRSVVVAGTGPLLAAVAAGILAKGGAVAAIVDAHPRAAWIASLPHFAARPRLLATGAAWLARIVRSGVPILSGHRIAAAEGAPDLATIRAVPIAGGPAREIACDALCIGHGLVPASEPARLLGARHRYDAPSGGWVPELDSWQRSSVARLAIAGDGAGIAGAAAAPITGRLAALAALTDLGRLPPGQAQSLAAPLQRQLVATSRFAAASAALMVPPPALLDAIPPDCVVCRCEDITRAEIDSAIAAGARDINQMKQFTRCGMGPCQGRMCGDAAAELLARHVGGREAAGCATARLPLRPVPMHALLGDFDYADIPIPAPAPI